MFSFNMGIATLAAKKIYGELLHTRLYTNSIFLIGNSGANGALSFVFWVLVSRMYPVEAVGLGSAIISAALLLAFIANLGLEYGLIRFLPDSGNNSSRLINSCFLLTGFIAVVSAAVFLIGLPKFSPDMLFLRESPWFIIAFVGFVSIRAIFNLVTSVYIGRRRAEYSLLQAVLLGLLRILVLISIMLVGWLATFGIVLSWGLASVLTFLVGVLCFLPRVNPGYRPDLIVSPGEASRILPFSLGNYLSRGLWYAPRWLLLLMVLNLLGQEATGYFSISWAVASYLFAIPLGTSQSLFSEGSNQEQFLARDTKKSLRFILVLLVPTIALVLIFANLVLSAFGHEYAGAGTGILWILAASALPVAVNTVYLSIARVRKQLGSIILVSAIIASLSLGLSYLLTPVFGLLAPAIAWLAGNVIAASWSLPSVISTIRQKESAIPVMAAR